MKHFMAIAKHFVAIGKHFMAIGKHFVASAEARMATAEHFMASAEARMAIAKHFMASAKAPMASGDAFQPVDAAALSEKHGRQQPRPCHPTNRVCHAARGFRFPYPNGIQSLSPGLVASATYPGFTPPTTTSTPTGLHQNRIRGRAQRRCNPYRVVCLFSTLTQGRPLARPTLG